MPYSYGVTPESLRLVIKTLKNQAPVCPFILVFTHLISCIPVSNYFPSVQFSSVTQSCSNLCNPITNSQSPPKPMSIESVMPSNHLILCRPLLLLPSIFPSLRVFSNESALRIRRPKHWSFSFNISPSNEHPGLISFRMDWLDLLAVQGTLKSLLQHHSSNLSIKPCLKQFLPDDFSLM